MPAVGSLYEPSADDAEEWDFTGDDVEDSVVFTTYVPAIADAGHVPYKVQNELLALRKAALSGKQYQKVFTCGVGDVVGSAVYLSADDTVSTAKADTSAHAQPFGFIIYKPTTGTCIVVHYYQSTVAGATAGGAIYLKDDGTFGPTPGTISVPIGVAFDATHALLVAGPLSPFNATTNQQKSGIYEFPDEIDLKTGATTTLTLPSGKTNPDAMSVKLSTLGGTITGQPQIQLGKTGTNNYYLDTIATVGLSAVGKRNRFDTFLTDDDSASLTFTVVVAATGSAAIKGRVTVWGSPPQ